MVTFADVQLQSSSDKNSQKNEKGVKKSIFEKPNKKFSSVVLKNRKRNSSDKNVKEIRSSHTTKFNGSKMPGKFTTFDQGNEGFISFFIFYVDI